MIKDFSKKLKENINRLQDRINHKKASAIIIDGGLGEGKTTLAVELADYINSLRGLPEVDLNKKTQLATGGDEFQEKIIKCYEQGLPALIYDEAGDFNTRGFITNFNRDLYKTFNICRAYKIFIILCLPSFTDLDNGIFKTQVPRLLLNVRDRDTKGYFYGYSLKTMLYMKQNINRYHIPSPFVYKTQLANFIGIFKDLSPARSKLLDKISTDKKLEMSRSMRAAQVVAEQEPIELKDIALQLPSRRLNLNE
jgi:hypothetical protein